MGIFSRLTDIINSNINALLDQAEDPKKLIRLIIQEMEETLIEVRSSSVRLIADKKEATRRIAQLRTQADEWENKAKLALSKNREDLARAAILEKSTIGEDVAVIEAEVASLEEHLAKLEGEVAQLQTKLNDAKAKQKTILLREKTVQSRYKVKSQLHNGKFDEAFNKFEAFERRLDEYEGHIESLDMGRKDLASEIDQLQKDDKVDSELERLKAEMKGE